jgi:hypothetical protein
MEYLRSSSWCRNWPVHGKKRCRLHGGFSTGPRTPEGKARTIAAMVEGRRRLLEVSARSGLLLAGARKLTLCGGPVNAAPLAASGHWLPFGLELLEAFLSQKFRRQHRQAREVAKREVERLLAEHEEQRRRLRFPPLSPEQREAVIEGFGNG